MTKQLELPTVINEDCWFYEANKEELEKHLGRPYLSYSSIEQWNNYREDYIKSKFGYIKLPMGVYAEFGNFVGHYLEHGKVMSDNPHGFTGVENLSIMDNHLRPGVDDDETEHEAFVCLDMGSFIVIGFVDELLYKEYGLVVVDLKTGGSSSEKKYRSSKYIQTTLYAHALEEKGYRVMDTKVYFVLRTGSHIKPPLHISDNQFFIDVKYDEKVVKKALTTVNNTALEIEDMYKTYKKIFK